MASFRIVFEIWHVYPVDLKTEYRAVDIFDCHGLGLDFKEREFFECGLEKRRVLTN